MNTPLQRAEEPANDREGFKEGGPAEQHIFLVTWSDGAYAANVCRKWNQRNMRFCGTDLFR